MCLDVLEEMWHESTVRPWFGLSMLTVHDRQSLLLFFRVFTKGVIQRWQTEYFERLEWQSYSTCYCYLRRY